MTPDAVRLVVQRLNEAMNRHDVDAVGKLFTDDCVFEDTSPPDGNRHVGYDAVMAAFRELFAGSPDAHFDDEEVIVAGDRAIIQWRYAWTDGHVRGVDVVRVRDGKIAESLAYVKG